MTFVSCKLNLFLFFFSPRVLPARLNCDGSAHSIVIIFKMNSIFGRWRVGWIIPIANDLFSICNFVAESRKCWFEQGNAGTNFFTHLTVYTPLKSVGLQAICLHYKPLPVYIDLFVGMSQLWYFFFPFLTSNPIYLAALQFDVTNQFFCFTLPKNVNLHLYRLFWELGFV